MRSCLASSWFSNNSLPLSQVIEMTCQARIRRAMVATTSALRRVETLTWMVIRVIRSTRVATAVRPPLPMM